MNIFDYFAEEEADIERKLTTLVEQYSNWTKEQVFDAVKEVCDAINAHVKKQTVLLLTRFENKPVVGTICNELKQDHARVQEEIGQLVEVHVDEPNYVDCLKQLLAAVEDHITLSDRIYKELQESASAEELGKLDSQFNNIVLHSVDFNTLAS